MRIEEIFVSAGVTPRSHNLASSRKDHLIVYASGHFLVIEDVPKSTTECGRILWVTECRHAKPITVVKRAKSHSDEELFVSGGADGKINLWKLIERKLEHIITIDAGKEPIISVSAAVRKGEIVAIASWGDELSGSLMAWWLAEKNNGFQITQTADMKATLPKRSFVLSMDCTLLPNGKVLTAVGTSLCKIELYYEQNLTFSKRLSVTGHSDWIHSIAFNDRKEKLLVASAGQDTYVKLWRIEQYKSGEDDELSVTKNTFTFEDDSHADKMTLNVEAVIAGHEDWVHSTEWNYDGSKLATASSDKTVIVWQENDGLWSDIVRLGIIGGQAAGFFAAVFTPDSLSIVASSYFGGLHSWRAEETDTSSWNSVTMCGGHVGEVRDIVWSPKGHYFLTVGKDQTTRLFAPQSSTGYYIEVARPQVHGYDMQCLTSVSNSSFVSGAEEKIFRAFRAPETFANSLCAISNYDKNELFDDQILENKGARLPALGLSNKAIEDGDQPDEEAHWEEAAFQANPENLTKPPTDDFLQQSTLWPELQKLYGHGFEVYAVACNPAKTVLATACKASHPEHAQIILWDIATWGKKNTIPGHQLTITQIKWSPDGRYLLTVSRDRTAVLYEEARGDLNGYDYKKFWSSGKEHSRIIWSCCWLDDSRRFLTVSRDQKMILWKIDEHKAVAMTSVKLALPITAVTVGSGAFRNTIACGLQNGSATIFALEQQQFQPVHDLFQHSVTVDSPVSRLRFFTKETEESALLAYAGTNGLIRILRCCL